MLECEEATVGPTWLENPTVAKRRVVAAEMLFLKQLRLLPTSLNPARSRLPAARANRRK